MLRREGSDPMVELKKGGVYLLKGQAVMADTGECSVQEANSLLQQAGQTSLAQESFTKEQAKSGTIAYQILSSHNQSGNPQKLQLKFDALPPMTLLM